MENCKIVFCGYILPALKALAGPFFGAGFAFMLQNWRTKREREAAKLSSLVGAQVALTCHMSSLVNLRTHIDRWREHPRRHVEIGFVRFIPDPSAVDVSPLSFIADRGHFAKLVTVQESEADYRTACDAVVVRNAILTKIESDIISDVSAADDGNSARDLILRDRTDVMFERIDIALASCLASMALIKELAAEFFPKAKFPLPREKAMEPQGGDGAQKGPASL